MSLLPAPSRRTLAELRATFLRDTEPTNACASQVRRAFVELITLLDAQAATLVEIDRIEVMLAARHGYPRVKLPTGSGQPPLYAVDAATVRRRLGTGPEARRLAATLSRRRRSFLKAAEKGGLPTVKRHWNGTPDRRPIGTPS